MIYAADAFAGRHIAVTGGSSGIGRAVAQALAQHGARTALIGRDEVRLSSAVQSLYGQGHSSHAIDLSDSDLAADKLTDVAKRHGAFDGIFYSAGTALVLPTRLTKSKHVMDVLGAAVFGALAAARAASRKGTMNNGGSLVFMSSVAASSGTAGMVAYSTAKAAIPGLVRSLALELADRRIRVNSIIAGAVETEMHANLAETMDEAGLEDYRAKHPLGFGRGEDMAHAAMFLLSDASTWVTGTNLVVDGGYTAK